MRGDGLTHVALLADHESELSHFMLQRLLRRSGMWNDTSFHLGTTSEAGLLESLQAKGIKAIVPLGERALRQSLGKDNIERWRGRVVEHPHHLPVHILPTFAPSQLLPHRGDEDDPEGMRNPPRFHGTWIRDVAKAVHVAKYGFTRAQVHYLCDPTVDAFEQWIAGYFTQLALDPETLLSFDIETPYKLSKKDEADYEEKEALFGDHILRISFAYQTHHAVSVPWTGLMMPGITRLLAAPGGKVVWNGATFDVPKILATGHVVNGTVFDYMDGWHVYQSDLDKGLEFVSSYCTDLLPWKHLNSGENAVIYSCIDADAALRNALQIKQWLIAGKQWDAFVDHSVRLMPILYKAGRHGNLIDLDAQAALITELDGLKVTLTAEAQPLVPRELKPRAMRKTQPDELPGTFFVPAPEPDRYDGLLDREGDEWDVIWEPEDVKYCTACNQPASNKSEHFKGSLGPLNAKGKPTRIKNPCKEAGGAIEPRPAFVPRFYQVLPFNTNSGDQMRAYIKWAGHPMGVDKKDSTKETADAKHLKDLHKRHGVKHPIYGIALKMALVSKTRGTYCPTPDELGLIHTTYKNNTSTWRLASAALNMQNWGKREGNPYAKRARKQIIARPGHTLVQIDSASVEAVMLGYFMGDRKYMSLASRGIHTWLTCMELGWPFDDEHAKRVKKEHEHLYNGFKMANHMTNYGGGAYVLWQSHPDLFPKKSDAERVQNRIFQLLPKLPAFHHEVRVRAQKETVLVNPWGHKHYFYDVFTKDKTGKTKFGKDSKRAVAYLPQSSNGSFQRDNILLIADEHTQCGRSLVDFMPANLSVHDSMCLDTPNHLVEEVTSILTRVFTRPIPQMQGLRIGAEVEVGSNWGEMRSAQKIAITDYDELEAAA